MYKITKKCAFEILDLLYKFILITDLNSEINLKQDGLSALFYNPKRQAIHSLSIDLRVLHINEEFEFKLHFLVND